MLLGMNLNLPLFFRIRDGRNHVIDHVDELAACERAEFLAVEQTFESLGNRDSPLVIQEDDDRLGGHSLRRQIWVGLVEKPVQPIQQAHEFILRQVQNGVIVDFLDDTLKLDHAENLIRRGLGRTCRGPLTDAVE